MTMKSMIKCDQWDIILVRFPFTDHQSGKKRPALVIFPPEYNTGKDVIILFVTSQLDRHERPGDYLIKNWKAARLPKPSLVRMKFATIDKSIITRKIGKLDRTDIMEFRKILAQFFLSDG